MSKLMIKGQQASGIYGNASDIKINEISGLTASNAQEALVALNNSLSTLQTKIKSKTFSGTTEAGTGNIPIGSAANIIIIASVVSNGGITSYPFIYGANNLWYVHCMNTAGATITTPTDVGGTVYYLEL